MAAAIERDPVTDPSSMPEAGVVMYAGVRSSVTSDEAVISVDGDIDLANSDQIADAVSKVIAEHRLATVVFDLESVDFIDSTGLRMLWEIRQTAQEASAILILRSPSDAVSRLLRLTGMHRIFQIEVAD